VKNRIEDLQKSDTIKRLTETTSDTRKWSLVMYTCIIGLQPIRHSKLFFFGRVFCFFSNILIEFLEFNWYYMYYWKVKTI